MNPERARFEKWLLTLDPDKIDTLWMMVGALKTASHLLYVAPVPTTPETRPWRGERDGWQGLVEMTNEHNWNRRPWPE